MAFSQYLKISVFSKLLIYALPIFSLCILAGFPRHASPVGIPQEIILSWAIYHNRGKPIA
jgi:hypothetical protein